jgi:hypothetical protein
MDMMSIRRRLMLSSNTRTLPTGYSALQFIARDASENGPYCEVNTVLNSGDKVVSITRAYSVVVEQGFAGKPGYFEMQYSYSELKVWGTGFGLVSAEYGPPDTLTAVANRGGILQYIGCYRTNKYKFNGEIHSIKILDSYGNIKHDFVPAVRELDEEPGFFERITGVFYDNVAGTGNFIPGPKI